MLLTIPRERRDRLLAVLAFGCRESFAAFAFRQSHSAKSAKSGPLGWRQNREARAPGFRRQIRM
jgi:hypothetical protein